MIIGFQAISSDILKKIASIKNEKYLKTRVIKVIMKKDKNIKKFSSRLASIRKEKCLSQQQLAGKINVSRRFIAYYEAESDNPPSNLVVLLSKVLSVSADEFLGIKPIKNNGTKQTISF
ncbi:MAG: helix-turn-helix domain-containing protein [Desulfobacterales bacterium]|nr:helix-turn-helix domain-containing protein [Desulfobacterales bacterium]